MTLPTLVSFVAGRTGSWRIERIHAVAGESLPAADSLEVVDRRDHSATPQGVWTLSGTTSNARYTTQVEAAALAGKQEGLGRAGSTCAALIPMRKSPKWWALAQDQRREIIEAKSRHIEIGMHYLPAVARRLHHCRDMGEPFDFLTWFEYSASDAPAFEELLARLRATEEWQYVDREVDIRLQRV